MSSPAGGIEPPPTTARIICIGRVVGALSPCARCNPACRLLPSGGNLPPTQRSADRRVWPLPFRSRLCALVPRAHALRRSPHAPHAIATHTTQSRRTGDFPSVERRGSRHACNIRGSQSRILRNPKGLNLMADRRHDAALAGNILRVVIYIDLQAGIVAEFTYDGGHK